VQIVIPADIVDYLNFWPLSPLETPRAPMVTSAGLSLRVGFNTDVLSASKSVENRLLAVFDQYFGPKTAKKPFLALSRRC
jgi:hypothetical protein